MKKWFSFSLILIVILTACTPTTPAVTPTAPPVVVINTPTATAPPPPPVALPTSTPVVVTPTQTPRPTPVTVKLVVWANLPPAQADKLVQEAAAFQRDNPAVVVEVQPYEDPQVLAKSIADGRVDYSLVLGPKNLLAPLQQNNKLQPMSEIFPASFLDDFSNVGLQGVSAAGDYWGLPDNIGFHLLLFYNKTLINPPPATTDGLFNVAVDLSSDTNPGLVLNSYEPLWVLPWLSRDGGRWRDAQGNIRLNTPAMTQTLAMLQTWQTQGATPVLEYDEASRLFREGQAAMFIDGAWSIAALAETDVDWGVAPLPAVNGQAATPLVLGRYWAVSNQLTGREAELAIRFLESVTQPARQLAWTSAFGLLPTRRSALNDPLITGNPQLNVSARQAEAGQALTLHEDDTALLNALRPALRQFVDGELTPLEAAAAMQARYQQGQ